MNLSYCKDAYLVLATLLAVHHYALGMEQPGSSGWNGPDSRANTLPIREYSAERVVQNRVNFALVDGAKNGNLEIVNHALAAGADVNGLMPGGNSALYVAIEGGHYDIVKLLLEHKADVNAARRFGGGGALSWAIACGHEKIVQLLLDKGANPDAADDEHYTPFYWASLHERHKGIIRILLRHGAFVDNTNGRYIDVLKRVLEGKPLLRGVFCQPDKPLSDLIQTASLSELLEALNYAVGQARIGPTILLLERIERSAVNSLREHYEFVCALLTRSYWTSEKRQSYKKIQELLEQSLQPRESGQSSTLLRQQISTVNSCGACTNKPASSTPKQIRSLQTLAANVLFETFSAKSLRHACGQTFFKNHGNDFLETVYMFLLIKHMLEKHSADDYLLIDKIRSYPYLVEVLLTHCDEVMKKELTIPLLFGVGDVLPCLQTLEVLIRHNIDINYHKTYGGTLLHNAALKGNVDIARMLLDHGAQINALALIPSTGSEQTPLGRVLYKFNDNHPIVKLLRSQGALTVSEIKAQEEEQKQKEQRERRARENRLVALAAVGDIPGVRSLLSQGVDINACNDNGETALWLAARNSYLKMVIFLLSKRANINVRNMNGNTALMLAAGNRNPALVCQLLMLGADVHRENEQGNTALMLAALNDSLEIVRMLIRRGADINYFNHRGESAFDFVAHNAFNLEVLRFLLHPTSSRRVVLQAIEVDEGEFQQYREIHKMLERVRKEYMLEYEPKSAIPAEELVPLKSALSDDRHPLDIFRALISSCQRT